MDTHIILRSITALACVVRIDDRIRFRPLGELFLQGKIFDL